MNGVAPRILVVRVGAMGDVIHALPAVAMLREMLPDAHIGWAIEPRWAPLLRANQKAHGNPEPMQLVDAVHLVEAKQWNRHPVSLATLRSIASLRRELRSAQYNIAIDLQGTLRSAVIARLSGAKVVGSSTPRENIARLLYRTQVRCTTVHVVDQAIEIVQVALAQLRSADSKEVVISTGHLHRPAEWRNQHSLLPRDPSAETWWCQRRKVLGPERGFVLLAATAGWGAKEWPTENFAALAAALVDQGYSVLLNTIPNGVDTITAHVMQQAAVHHPQSAPHIHLLPATLPELIAAVRDMRAVIAGDTGPLHLAEFLGIPTVGLFGPTDPARTGTRYRAICLRDAFSITDHRRHAHRETGLARITIAQVMDAFAEVNTLGA